MMGAEQAPVLSVVVALISGKAEHLAACLTALYAQTDPPPLEILVPYDAPVAAVTTLQPRFPDARFICAEGLDTAAARAGVSREHHDALRTTGIKQARGRVIALTEDHATVSNNWCRDLVRLLDEHPGVGALGGAVECGSTRLLNQAVYYCDFGRYQNPLQEGAAEFVSDSNVVYGREALEAIRDVWDASYHETLVHQALADAKRPLWLTPRTVVWQARGDLSLWAALRERMVWGRSFAGTRVAGAPLASRAKYAVASSLLPVLLTFRIVRGVVRRGRLDVRFLCALPLVFLLNTAWAAGECVGYVHGAPT